MGPSRQEHSVFLIASLQEFLRLSLSSDPNSAWISYQLPPFVLYCHRWVEERAWCAGKLKRNGNVMVKTEMPMSCCSPAMKLRFLFVITLEKKCYSGCCKAKNVVEAETTKAFQKDRAESKSYPFELLILWWSPSFFIFKWRDSLPCSIILRIK